MPSYKRPGSYVEEIINPSVGIGRPNLSLGAFLAPNGRGPTVPTLIDSWSRYLALFGGFGAAAYLLPWEVHQFFSNGGRQCYVVRPVGAGAVSALRTLNDRSMTVPLPTPAFTNSTTATTGGTIAAGTQSYRLTAINAFGETLGSAAQTQVTSGATSTVTLNWPAVAGATGYKIYGRTSGSEALLVTLGAVVTWTDNGSAVPGAALPTANTTSGSTNTPTLRVNANNVGAWGNGLNVDVVAAGDANSFSLIVRYGGTTDAFIVENWRDLSMDPTNPRYAPSIINSDSAGSTYISVTDLVSATAAPNNMPALQIQTTLAGGADGAAPGAAEKQAALTLLDQIDAPFNLALPGTIDAATINAALGYAAARGDVFVVCDTDQNLTAATAILAAQTYTQTSYGAAYWPWLNVSDPSSNVPGAIKKIPPSGAVLGQYAATDAIRGVFKTPAGTGNRLAGVLSLEAKPSATDLDNLNAANLNAIKVVPGVGTCIFGGRTLRNTATDRYISARRSLIYLRRALLDGTQWAAFEPNDAVLWSSLRTNIEKFLLGFWQAGGLRGSTAGEAFYVKCDAENNTQASINQGVVNIEIGVAVQQPAEFVVMRIGQWDGGSYARESALAA